QRMDGVSSRVTTRGCRGADSGAGGAGGSLLLVGAVVGSALFQTLLELPLRRAETACELRKLRAAEQHENDGQDDQEFGSEDLAEHVAIVPADGGRACRSVSAVSAAARWRDRARRRPAPTA